MADQTLGDDNTSSDVDSPLSSDGEIQLSSSKTPHFSSSSDEQVIDTNSGFVDCEVSAEECSAILQSLKNPRSSDLVLYPKAAEGIFNADHPGILKCLNSLLTEFHYVGFATKKKRHFGKIKNTPSGVICNTLLFSTTKPLSLVTFVRGKEVRRAHRYYNTQLTGNIMENVKENLKFNISVVHDVVHESLSQQGFRETFDQMYNNARIKSFPRSLLMSSERCAAIAKTIIQPMLSSSMHADDSNKVRRSATISPSKLLSPKQGVMAGTSHDLDAKESQVQCQICHVEYDGEEHIPRRMSCCFQTVCESCLEKLMSDDNHLTCPYCRYRHHICDGFSSFPEENLIIEMLNFKKIQKGLSLPCTSCRKKINPAVARCDECEGFICQECLDRHGEMSGLRKHKTTTFEKIKGMSFESFHKNLRCHKHYQPFKFYCRTCSVAICTDCSVVDHDKTKDHNIVSIEVAQEEKATLLSKKIADVEREEQKLNSVVEELEVKRCSVESSCEEAKCETNKTFDNLIEQLQKQRVAQLDDIDDQSQKMMSEIALDENTMLLTRLRSSRKYITKMRAKMDAIEDINLMASSMKPLQDMLDQTQENVTYKRTSVAFVPANVNYLDQLIKTTGLVRSVTFTPTTDKSIPGGYDVVMSPASLPEGPIRDFVISFGFTCPRVEWDPSTASRCINIAGSTVSNMEPDSSVHNTGCRFQQTPRVTSIRPLVVMGDQQMLLSVKMTFRTKEALATYKFIYELALTPTPVDTTWGQSNGVSVMVATSDEDSAAQLYLQIGHNNTIQCKTPVCVNQAEVSVNICLFLLLDGSRGAVNIVDEEKVIGQVRGVNFDDPMWLVVNIGHSSSVEMKCEVVSGEGLKLSENTKSILSGTKKESLV